MHVHICIQISSQVTVNMHVYMCSGSSLTKPRMSVQEPCLMWDMKQKPASLHIWSAFEHFLPHYIRPNNQAEKASGQKVGCHFLCPD